MVYNNKGDKMTGDEMEIVSPTTGGITSFVDAENNIHEKHDCVFQGDHSKGLDPDDTCIRCGKLLGDYIVEGWNPLEPKIPIIIDSKENNNE